MADRIGLQLGNYRLIDVLGHGGFAEVYLGEHIYLKTKAAIKVLQTRLSSPADMESFLKEAQMIAHLSHPNIVRILDFGIDGEVPFLVMDYAPNGTLRQKYPAGTSLPLLTVTQYAKQIADALQYAHDEKLVHRDVKPENILLGRRNEVLLSDFGIALIAQSSRYQNTQDVTGTVAYMSPEQIQGKPRPASDQYSLGIVVFEWLSGERPFRGSFTELCTQHMFAPIPSLREKVPTIPAGIEQVVATALAKDPKQRFGNIQAFANALEHASQAVSKTESVPPVSVPMTLKPFAEPVQAPPIVPVDPVSLPLQAMPTLGIPPTMEAKSPPESVLPPTQYAPPLVHTQHASTLSSPSADPHVRRTLSQDKVRIWSVGRRQIAAMLVGTFIFGILDYALDKLYLNLITANNTGAFANFGGSTFLPSFMSLLLYGILSSIPVFFGSEFGPWTGLVVMLAGSLLGDYVSGYIAAIFASQPLWLLYMYPCISILGFVPGLALIRTNDRYNTRSTLITAIIFIAIAILVSSTFQAIGDNVVYQMNFFSSLSYYALSNAPEIILVPILIIFYKRVFKRKARTL